MKNSSTDSLSEKICMDVDVASLRTFENAHKSVDAWLASHGMEGSQLVDMHLSSAYGAMVAAYARAHNIDTTREAFVRFEGYVRCLARQASQATKEGTWNH